ncbi:hypothetical protein FRC07_000268, partial [Ceratobasidium sp. 392]
AVTLTRWFISPDPELIMKGRKTGISWLEDYWYYRLLIIEGLRTKDIKFRATRTIGPFTQLKNKWNNKFFPVQDGNDQGGDENQHTARPNDVRDALAQINQFAEDLGAPEN